MRNFPSEKALVTAYWRKLTRSNGQPFTNHRRVSARRTVPVLKTDRHPGGRNTASRRLVGAERRPYRVRSQAELHSNS